MNFGGEGVVVVESGIRPVVVGVDGSSTATHAVRWAAREAAYRDRPLTIVHVCALVPGPLPHAEGLMPAYREAMREQGRKYLGKARAAAQDAAPQVAVNTELVTGWAAEHLISRSASAELVVLGSRGLGGFTGLVVGSVAVAVASHGHCPIVVVRSVGTHPEPPLEGPVVVGTDGSPAGAAAVPFAFRAAALRGVPLVAVHCWMDQPMLLWEEDWERIQQHLLIALGEWLAASRAEYPEVPVELLVARERPAHTLLQHGQKAQLVVVGSRGRGGFRGLLLGSTSQALVHHAACPVAVVPTIR